MNAQATQPEITLEQAQAVIRADRDARCAARAIEARKLIGRFFKFRNSYGSARKWWLYAAPRVVDDDGSVSGLSFQRTHDGRIEVRCADYLTVGDVDWTEITSSEFWAVAAQLRVELVGRLTEGAA